MHRDNVFGGSVAEIYETCMVPMLFEHYAADLASRMRARACARVLEVGAGTGVLTRALANALTPETTIVATDLNPAMLDRATAAGPGHGVEWRQADVSRLPFADTSFDAVVCQFAAMFFPDKPRAFSEVRRVLAPGGVFVFSVWDRLEDNEFAAVVNEAVGAMFPDDPPAFMARTPHGYHDPSLIVRDLAAAGFTAPPRIETIAARSRAASAFVAAMALCQGSPLRTEIEARESGRLEEATAVAAAAISARFGAGAIDGRMQAHVISVDR
jgi:SAM-dependent methyltransferase